MNLVLRQMSSELDIAFADVSFFAAGSCDSAAVLSFCTRAIVRATANHSAKSAMRRAAPPCAAPVDLLESEVSRRGPSVKRALELTAEPLIFDISGAKPLAALDLLEAHMPQDPVQRAAWRSKARVAAVMGSCPRSHASFKSGVKHWTRFIKITHGSDAVDLVAFPPRLEDVLAWSNTFRCAVLHPLDLSPVSFLLEQGVLAPLPIISATFVPHATPWDSKPHQWVTQQSGEH